MHRGSRTWRASVRRTPTAGTRVARMALPSPDSRQGRKEKKGSGRSGMAGGASRARLSSDAEGGARKQDATWAPALRWAVR